jgi:hypothetical protein
MSPYAHSKPLHPKSLFKEHQNVLHANLMRDSSGKKVDKRWKLETGTKLLVCDKCPIKLAGKISQNLAIFFLVLEQGNFLKDD